MALPFLHLLVGALAAALLLTFVLNRRPAEGPAASRNRTTVSPWAAKRVLVLTDALVMISAWTIALPGTAGFLPPAPHLVMQTTLMVATIGWFWVFLEHYGLRRPFWDELREIVRVMATMFLVALALPPLIGLQLPFRESCLLWLAYLLFVPLGRALARRALDAVGLWKIPVLIIGSGANAREAFMALSGERSMGYDILAFVQADPEAGDRMLRDTGIPVMPLGALTEAWMLEKPGLQLILALDSLSTPESQALVQRFSSLQRHLHIIPALRGLPLFGMRLSHFFSHEVLFMTVQNNLARRSYRWAKRAFDIIVSLALLVLLAPLFAWIALSIRRSGGSSPFYGHLRVGQKGEPFRCLKFRSMRPDADEVLEALLRTDPAARAEWERDFKLKNDPRITPIGAFLRRTSLDELPQLINVLRGEMSLVGPRPVVAAELERYGEQAALYMEAKPGVTGLWQISGRNDTTYAERVALDSWYVRNWSIWYDVAILVRTIPAVTGSRGAY